MIGNLDLRFEINSRLASTLWRENLVITTYFIIVMSF